MSLPTIGRVVYYRPSALELKVQQIFSDDVTQPFRADVCKVNTDGTVNLSVNDHWGHVHNRANISFQEAEVPGQDGPYAHWMPYQLAQQAAKAAPTAPTAPTAPVAPEAPTASTTPPTTLPEPPAA